MMVGNIGSTNPLITPNLWHASRIGKTSVPMRPIQSVYAHFKHIVGVPSHDVSQTVSFSRLRHLDHMIERLVQMHKRAGQLEDPVEAAKTDAHVQALHSQIHANLATASSFGGSAHAKGYLVKLTV